MTSAENVKLPAAQCQRLVKSAEQPLEKQRRRSTPNRKTDRAVTSHKTDRVVGGCDPTTPSQDGSQGARRPIMCCFRAGEVGTLADGGGETVGIFAQHPGADHLAKLQYNTKKNPHQEEKRPPHSNRSMPGIKPNPDQQGTPSAALWFVDRIHPRGYCRCPI